MPRFLKTTFPCAICGAPGQEVERLSDGPRVHCRRCVERNNHVSVGNFNNKRADEAMDRVPDDGPESARVAVYLLAIENRIASARSYMECIPVARKGERRLLVRVARSRAVWAEQALNKLREVIDAALSEEQNGLEVVSGCGAVEVADSVVRPPPRLMLLPTPTPPTEESKP